MTDWPKAYAMMLQAAKPVPAAPVFVHMFGGKAGNPRLNEDGTVAWPKRSFDHQAVAILLRSRV